MKILLANKNPNGKSGYCHSLKCAYPEVIIMDDIGGKEIPEDCTFLIATTNDENNIDLFNKFDVVFKKLDTTTMNGITAMVRSVCRKRSSFTKNN